MSLINNQVDIINNNKINIINQKKNENVKLYDFDYLLNYIY